MPDATSLRDDVAGPGTVEVRLLTDLRDLREVDDLFTSVWGPGTPTIGVEMLRALSHAGGYVSGAYLDGTIVGASGGFLGQHDGHVSLHSHATGVSPRARGLHAGRALKLHQRSWAIERRIGLVTWTFDPLVRRNAWFNIARLGARPVEYLIDFYGPMTDAINAGVPSDRLLMAWDVTRPLPTAEVHESAYRRVSTPEDIEALRIDDPAAAGRWRMQVRDELRDAADAGRVMGFTREGDYVIDA
ncbi:MAG: GNAT family N-acetyltransferase [Actinomycetota bacterium]